MDYFSVIFRCNILSCCFKWRIHCVRDKKIVFLPDWSFPSILQRRFRRSTLFLKFQNQFTNIRSRAPGAAVFCSIFCCCAGLCPRIKPPCWDQSSSPKNIVRHILEANLAVDTFRQQLWCTIHNAQRTIDQKTKINTSWSIDLQCASRWTMRSAVRRLLDPRRVTTTPRIIWVLISRVELSSWLHLQKLLQHSWVISSWLVVSGSKYSRAIYSLFSRPMICVLHRSPAKCFPSRLWLLICGSM